MFIRKPTAHARTIARRSIWMALTLLVVFLSSTLLLSAGSASAATSFTLRGPVINAASGVRVAGATVHLYRWNGSTWGDSITRTRTNADGSYTIYNVPTGYYYYVSADKFYPGCTPGVTSAWYVGNSEVFAPPSTTTGFRAPVYIYFDRWWTC